MSPPADVSIRPVQLEDVLVGESYVTWVCDDCLGVIALGSRSQGADPHVLPDASYESPVHIVARGGIMRCTPAAFGNIPGPLDPDSAD